MVIIIAILFIAVLGAAIYTMTYVATLNQVLAQRAARAFYLSESGIRIAAGEYKAATNKNATLIALNDKIFPIPDSASSNNVKIKIYPYWFYANTSYEAGVTTLTLNLPGELPPIDDAGDAHVTFPASGLLKIKDQGRSPAWVGSTATTTFARYGAVSSSDPFNAASGKPVTFTLSASFPAAPNQIIAGDEFYIGGDSYVSTQDTNQGGNLIMNLTLTDTNDDTAKIFPPQKGTIFVVTASKISLYSYTSRIIATTSSPHTVTLTNIQPIAGAPTPKWPLTVSSGTQVYVGKSVGFRSTSTYGQ